MDTIGVDLHKRETQLCIGQADGSITEQRIVTSRERFTAVLGHRPPARILVEASTESEWVACHLESLGHEVIVADPNYAPMYATRARRVKTDRRDARTLMEACWAVTASALVATIDDVQRFASAHQFEAYLGVVPGERSSGELRRIGPITKAGNRRARWLLVEAAWRILRSKDPASAPLRAWARPIAARRGPRIAAVALARRLAGILYAMWRDSVPYDARKVRRPRRAPGGPAS